MGYDRQRSPYGTRLFLTCYSLFLLLNVLLHANKLTKEQTKSENQILIFGIISVLIFSISLYGLWFAQLIILCFIALLFYILLGTTIISIILISLNVSLLRSSIYFCHNYLFLFVSSTRFLRLISLLFSCLLNVISLWGVCHLCICIEYHHKFCLYQKRTRRTLAVII
jgi:hypothetical protein